MSQIVMIMVELTSESCSCLVNMSGCDHRVLYRFRIDDDGDEISHLSIWCHGGLDTLAVVVAADGVARRR